MRALIAAELTAQEGPALVPGVLSVHSPALSGPLAPVLRTLGPCPPHALTPRGHQAPPRNPWRQRGGTTPQLTSVILTTALGCLILRVLKTTALPSLSVWGTHLIPVVPCRLETEASSCSCIMYLFIYLGLNTRNY